MEYKINRSKSPLTSKSFSYQPKLTDEEPRYSYKKAITIDQRNSKISPIKTFKPQNTKTNDIDVKLQKVFEYYCSYGERMNHSNLKLANFHKFTNDAKIIDNNLNKTRIELIYTTETKINKKKFGI